VQQLQCKVLRAVPLTGVQQLQCKVLRAVTRTFPGKACTADCMALLSSCSCRGLLARACAPAAAALGCVVARYRVVSKVGLGRGVVCQQQTQHGKAVVFNRLVRCGTCSSS
jgi:hypothetical protein